MLLAIVFRTLLFNKARNTNDYYNKIEYLCIIIVTVVHKRSSSEVVTTKEMACTIHEVVRA